MSDQVKNFVRVTDFVVIPRYNFNESISQSDTSFSVEDRSTSVTQEVRRNYCIFSVTQDNLSSIDQIIIEIPENDLTPEEKLLKKDMEECMQQAIRQLPEKTRIVYCMAKEDHMSYKQISEALDISERTVNTHMTTAIRRLMETFSNTFDKSFETLQKVRNIPSLIKYVPTIEKYFNMLDEVAKICFNGSLKKVITHGDIGITEALLLTGRNTRRVIMVLLAAAEVICISAWYFWDGLLM